MLLKAITEANNFFEAHKFTQRFSEDISPNSELYDVYMAKGSGEPKSDYPSKSLSGCDHLDFELDMPIK